MRKYGFILLMVAFTWSGCKKAETQEEHHHYTAASNLVILKVDYLTHQFEGGSMQLVSAAKGDSLPIKVFYKEPNDFGNVTLVWGDENKTIFDGSIVWNGKGSLRIPSLIAADNFSNYGSNAVKPDSVTIQYLNKSIAATVTPADSAALWQAIAPLSETNSYLFGQMKAALFLYTPSTGTGNPADWDYYWILYRRYYPIE